MSDKMSMQGFAEFLATKPADERYSYVDSKACPIFQYLQSLGEPVSSVIPGFWYDASGSTHAYNDRYDVVANHWTWGQAHQRALDMLLQSSTSN